MRACLACVGLPGLLLKLFCTMFTMAYTSLINYGIGMADGCFWFICSGLVKPIAIGVVPSPGCPVVDETPVGCETIGWSFTAPDILKTPDCSPWMQQQWSTFYNFMTWAIQYYVACLAVGLSLNSFQSAIFTKQTAVDTAPPRRHCKPHIQSIGKIIII